MARPARVIGFDFPFSIPHQLLSDPTFAADADFKTGEFGTWRSFNWWVAQRLELKDPLDFAPFAAWRDPAQRARLWTKRATDVAAGGQPPLKDKFQATFQMMLLGNVLLAKLWESHKYRVLPFPGGRGDSEIIEVYPRASLRAMGLASYKARPDEALRVAFAACEAAGIHLDMDSRILALACHYNSGTAKKPDFALADAVVALCTTILYVEGKCRPALVPDPVRHEVYLKEREGAIWVPKRVSA